MASDFIHIDNAAPRVKPGVKVIKSADYIKYKTAHELWEISQENIKINKAEAESLKLKSIQTGLTKGAEEAKAKMARQMVESASTLAIQLSVIEEDLTEVVLAAVRKIITDYDDKALVLEAVKQGLKPVYNGQKVVIRVHPDSVPYISSQVSSLQHEISFLEILPDTRLDATDCIIESDIGIVDASIESQLLAIEAAVKQSVAASLSKRGSPASLVAG